MIEIANTGERIILEKETPLMIARHLCAYRFAKEYCIEKRVLDIGCGEGYGTYFLSKFAKEVFGIDYDEVIINYAKNKYLKENLKFYVFNIKDLCSFYKNFDVVCSFQVIEHLQDPNRFLLDVKNLLSKGGIFICSTPNKIDASPHSDIPLNKFHVQEYLYNEFKELLERHFREVSIFCLKRGKKLNFYRRLKKIGVSNFLPAHLNPVNRFYNKINCNNFLIVNDGLKTALDFIAVCRKA